MPLNHPPKIQLIAFGQGKLAADELSNVEQHLEVCTSCCETLLELQEDTFMGLVRDAIRIDLPADIRSAVSTPEIEGQSGGDTWSRAERSDARSTEPGQEADPEEIPAELAEHPRYRIVELIGRGGMGSVYRAEHRLMNRNVAIKLVKAQLVKRPLAVDRFHREVQAAAKLSHPNIVAAYDAEQAGGVHFLVMEFVNGTDLATIVQQHGPMSVTDACRCIQQAADGLQHAHAQGMVHRDIKPQNLMLSAGNQVRILDFGLAGFAAESALKGGVDQDADDPTLDAQALEGVVPGGDRQIETAAAHLTAMGSVMGTPDYMAPEQAADAHAADIRADIYSLGCTLHYLLTGRPPFEADNVLQKLTAHAHQLPQALTTTRKDVPAELSNIVSRMLAKNPAARFQTPAEVADALAPFARPVASPPARRVRILVAAAGLMLAGLLAGLIYVEVDKGQFIVDAADEKIAVKIGDQGLKIHDATTDRTYLVKPGSQRVRSGVYEIDVAELPDGLEVQTTKFTLKRGGVARVSVTFKPKPEPTTNPGPATSPPEGKTLAQKTWNPNEITEVGCFTGHEGGASHAIVSPGGRYGISCGVDKTIRVWDIATREEKRVLKGHEGWVWGLAISTDGKLLSSSDKNKSIRLWNLETFEQVGELVGHTDSVSDVAFMADRTHLLSAGQDKTLRLWHIADRKLVRTIDIGTFVEKMLPLPDGQVLLSGAHTRGWGPITYNLEKGEKIQEIPGLYSCMAVSADGRISLIGSITGVLRVTDTSNGKLIVEMADPRPTQARDRAYRDAAITTDGRFAITTTRENQMYLWNLHEGKLLSSVTSKAIGTVTLSPDGRYALTIGETSGGVGVGVWRLPENILEPIR